MLSLDMILKIPAGPKHHFAEKPNAGSLPSKAEVEVQEKESATKNTPAK